MAGREVIERGEKRRTLSFAFLCATPFLVVGFVSRPLRVPGVYQSVGIVLFAAIALAIWTVVWKHGSAGDETRNRLAIAGTLLMAPFALIGLFWVGLGTPWDATPAENAMRYLVLVVMSVAEVAGIVVARDALADTSERIFAPLAAIAILIAGPVYLVWNVFMFGIHSAKEHTGEIPSVFLSLDQVLDVLLFFAGVLTYLAGALLAASMGRAQWLGRTAVRSFVLVSIAALLALVHRGLGFLAPAALSAPWYTVPGFIVGIPAVPFIAPCLLGAVLLRHAGEG